MKEFEGESLKSRVARAFNKIGWRCINISYKLYDNGIVIDESEDDILRRSHDIARLQELMSVWTDEGIEEHVNVGPTHEEHVAMRKFVHTGDIDVA